MQYEKEINDVETKLGLINAIKTVCEKKIYLEVEYARCVLKITQYKENDNEISEAAKILQEVQVKNNICKFSPRSKPTGRWIKEKNSSLSYTK
jgi:hypothetical protein